jgi:hypothetical protein
MMWRPFNFLSIRWLVQTPITNYRGCLRRAKQGYCAALFTAG